MLAFCVEIIALAYCIKDLGWLNQEEENQIINQHRFADLALPSTLWYVSHSIDEELGWCAKSELGINVSSGVHVCHKFVKATIISCTIPI